LLEFELEALDDLSGGGYPSVIRTGLGQELRIVPAGDFTMGTSRREPDRRSNEVLRDVSLSRAFYLGAHEVTNAEFRRFRESHNSGDFAGHSLNDDDQPVVNVSWADVVQFLNFLSINDALQPVYQETAAGWVAAQPLRNGYRLPTEAEWAWAARFANQEEPLYFPWGNDLPPPDRSGNYADIAAADILPTTLSTYSDGFPVSAPVGSFDRNALGVYDLGGNVAEWIHDFYELTITTSEEPLVDPLGPERGTYHVVRGTSWKSASERNLRVAYRDYSTGPREDLGFRIARDLD
jgi:formylglycine-generating enzyme required for sulfatase activity